MQRWTRWRGEGISFRRGQLVMFDGRVTGCRSACILSWPHWSFLPRRRCEWFGRGTDSQLLSSVYSIIRTLELGVPQLLEPLQKFLQIKLDKNQQCWILTKLSCMRSLTNRSTGISLLIPCALRAVWKILKLLMYSYS